jgi:hypothetical protein
MMKRIVLAILILAAMGAEGLAAPATTEPGVSRQEYEQLLREQEQMRREIAQLRAERAAPATQPAGANFPQRLQAAASGPAAGQPVSQEDFDDLAERVRKVTEQVHSALPGTQHLVIAGDASIGFINQKGSNSTFNAALSPLFLWEPTDRLLFEAAFDLGIATDASGNSSTSIDLTIANASIILNDHLVVGGGLFVLPFGQYHNHFDPPWIEKLPDAPLPFGDGGIAPSSEVGIFARGAFPIRGLPNPFGSAKVTYDVYLTNGPGLITNDPTAAGRLNFSDFTDLNNGKAAGGRVGFLPFPNIEFGYSILYAQVAPSGFPKAYALLQAADLNWVQDVRPLGTFTLRSEWVWSSVGPTGFENYRDGGYAEIAFRPSYFQNRVVRNLEFIFRYDILRIPTSAPGGGTEQRYELGIDYWLTPSWVLKVAYAIDDRSPGQGQNAFFVQLGIGL